MKHIIKVNNFSDIPQVRPMVAMTTDGSLFQEKESSTPPQVLINFRINGDNTWQIAGDYQAIDGMTWKEWLASDICTCDYLAGDYGDHERIKTSGGWALCESGDYGGWVYTDDLIIANGVYGENE